MRDMRVAVLAVSAAAGGVAATFAGRLPMAPFGTKGQGLLTASDLHTDAALPTVEVAVAAIYSLLHPGLYLHFVSNSDLFLLGFYLVLLGGTAARASPTGVRCPLVIDATTIPRSKSVNDATAQAVSEVAARDHIKLELDFVPGIRLSPARADALLSLRHKGLSARLRFSDNGSGFDIVAEPDGFGLNSMRYRATTVGGDLRISSVPGRGTAVEVEL